MHANFCKGGLRMVILGVMVSIIALNSKYLEVVDGVENFSLRAFQRSEAFSTLRLGWMRAESMVMVKVPRHL